MRTFEYLGGRWKLRRNDSSSPNSSSNGFHPRRSDRGEGLSANHGLCSVLLALLAGIGAVCAGLLFGEQSYKVWAVALAIGVLPIIAAVTRRPKDLLLFLWIVSLTYNRQYFSFAPIVGYNGLEGPYWMVSDLFLVALFGWALFERLLTRKRAGPFGPPLWPWYLPFAAACLLSGAGALRPDWTAYEMLRIVKVGLVFIYLRYNVGKREWWLCIAAAGFAACFQSAIGIKEVLTGRVGLLGLSAPPEGIPSSFLPENFYGWIRGTGTMAHPPYLASYLLLVLPVLLALSLTARRRQALLYGIAFLIGSGGLICTLSRSPWVIAFAECVAVLLALAFLREMALKRAVGLLCIGTLILAAGLGFFRQKLVDRVTRDWDESVEWRKESLNASFQLIHDNPISGVGLNNSMLYMHKYLPEMDWAGDTEQYGVNILHLRPPVTIGNGLLHVVEETGILGGAAFLFYLAGVFLIAIRATFRTRGEWRAASVGLLIGILGILAEQLVDAPLWVDPNLFTFTLFVALLNSAGFLYGQSRREAAVKGQAIQAAA